MDVDSVKDDYDGQKNEFGDVSSGSTNSKTSVLDSSCECLFKLELQLLIILVIRNSILLINWVIGQKKVRFNSNYYSLF